MDPPKFETKNKQKEHSYGDSAGIWTGTLAQSRYVPSEGVTLYQDGPAPAYTHHYDAYSGASSGYSDGIEKIRTRDIADTENENKWRKGWTDNQGPVLHLQHN